MATQSDNLGLLLPAPGDHVDVETQISNNFRKLDRCAGAFGALGADYGTDGNTAVPKAVALGYNNTIRNSYGLAVGRGHEILSGHGVAIGGINGYVGAGYGALFGGYGNTAQGAYSTAVGGKAGYALGAYSTAVGGAAAVAAYSTAIGYHSVGAASDTISIGHAAGDYNYAGGTYYKTTGSVTWAWTDSGNAPVTILPESTTVVPDGGYTLTGSNGTTVAVSAGSLIVASTGAAGTDYRVCSTYSTGLTRRIVNVAAGTNDTDAVNKAQLDAAIGTSDFVEITEEQVAALVADLGNLVIGDEGY